MERVVSATEARVRFGEMMRRAVEDQETIIVERSGIPQIVILSLQQYQENQLRLENKPDWLMKVESARALIADEIGDREIPPVEVIIRQMREDRDAELLNMP